jgi:hypothetical protein
MTIDPLHSTWPHSDGTVRSETYTRGREKEMRPCSTCGITGRGVQSWMCATTRGHYCYRHMVTVAVKPLNSFRMVRTELRVNLSNNSESELHKKRKVWAYCKRDKHFTNFFVAVSFFLAPYFTCISLNSLRTTSEKNTGCKPPRRANLSSRGVLPCV